MFKKKYGLENFIENPPTNCWYAFITNEKYQQKKPPKTISGNMHPNII